MCVAVVVLWWLTAHTANAQSPCIESSMLTDPDLPNMPVPVRGFNADCQECAFQCLANAQCQGFNWAMPGCSELPCPYAGGCCWLKKSASFATTRNITQQCPRAVGSYVMRAPKQFDSKPTQAVVTSQNKLRNVLYILVDDMRPNMQPYAQEYMYTPNLKSLAADGMTFSRAYCNIAVCSPSRMSFLTGRYPSTTRTWNFINHFRQANCQELKNGTYFESEEDVYKTVNITNGGAGQCCSLCTAEAGKCEAWTYTQNLCNPQGGGLGPCGECALGTLPHSTSSLAVRKLLMEEDHGKKFARKHRPKHTRSQGNLTLPLTQPKAWFRFRSSSTVRGWVRRRKRADHYAEPTDAMISGLVGTLVSQKWVSLPQHFTQAGYLTLSSGKIFHTEQGGDGPAPWDAPATGMPPLQDPPSWSPGNYSMANVNAIAPMRPCENNICSVPAEKNGDVPRGTFRFCDQIIGDDAVDKLNLAISNYKTSAQPFFMAVGFRKPHLPFRHPAPWDAYYPNVSDIVLAKHQKMDESVPPIAHHFGGIGPNPYEPIAEKTARLLRRDYYAAISWMDYNLGKVLAVLNNNPSVANETLVVFHADHGYSLGEHGQWEKFTNWEHGTRVPLIVKVPWLTKSKGYITNSIVELVDVFPSIAELANNPVPASYGLDGQSFAPLLADPTARLPKNTSLSVFPRCPLNTQDPTTYWQRNDCDMTERTNFFSMGVTIRENDWRYTEWTHWDGIKQQPMFDAKPIGVELYTHVNDTDVTFDGPWEQVNQAGQSEYAPVQARLAALLRARYNHVGLSVQ